MITLEMNKAHDFKVGEILHLKVVSIYKQAPGKWRLTVDEAAPPEWQLPDTEIKKLVKDYALECNAMLLGKENKAADIYVRLWFLYFQPSAYLTIADEVRRLVESEELPEPILSEWRR